MATPLPVPTAPVLTPSPTPAAFFAVDRLFYAPGFYVPEIQAFLEAQQSPLASMRFSVGDQRHNLAEVIVGQGSYYGVSSQFVLAMLEAQSGLVTDPSPSGSQMSVAAGFSGDNGRWLGLQGQIRWMVKQSFYARRDFPARVELTYADGSSAAAPASWGLSEYVIGRILAQTTTPGALPSRMQRFQDAYTRLFGDPRLPPEGLSPLAEPFMQRPFRKVFPVTSFFDHDAPFLMRQPRGEVMTYWGRAEVDMAFAYDGHDGWDYAIGPPDRILSTADGVVVFAGNADDGCATRAVVVEHGNGYRSLYWHLARVDVEIGQSVLAGDVLGIAGNSGCSLGPHLHLGVQYHGRDIDPYGWCGSGVDPWAAHPAGEVSVWLWKDRPSPCAPPPPGAVVVDASTSGFFQSGDGWQVAQTGYGGTTLFAPSVRGSSDREGWRLRSLDMPAVAVWRADLPQGTYRVLAYIPYALSGLEDPRQTEYRIRHVGGEASVSINARTYANDWADLGTYEFAGQSAVVLSNQCEEGRLSVWADAVMWVPVEAGGE
ncbi:MAG: peptidoglycan DD-metalloendopeptidase family protein [Roseiflexaceae bacterium]